MSSAFYISREESFYGSSDDDSSVSDYGEIEIPQNGMLAQTRNTLVRHGNINYGVFRPRKLFISTRNDGQPQAVEKHSETSVNALKVKKKFYGQDNQTRSKLEINVLRSNTLTYELERYNKNAMIIFNHENFRSDPTRRGTALDVAAIRNTFKRFGFEVNKYTTHNDLTRQELFNELKKFSRRDFKDYGCICVAILTHGQDHGYLKAFDTRYCERDVIEYFDGRLNPTLVGKPIIFLIQACRGRFPAYAVDGPHEIAAPSQTVELDAELPIERNCRPMDSDIIMFHSSFFGRASIRVVEEGTWFIQTLCEQMTLHSSTDHLEKLFRRVRRIVAQMEYEGAKQMPVVTSTLLKKLYLKEKISFMYSVADSSRC